MPTTAEECKALLAWAEGAPDASETPATSDQLARHLAFMAATLPSKNVDEELGKMRVAVYSKLLEGYSDKALAHMTRRVCETLDWFPTPRQCIEILSTYQAPKSDREQALILCHGFAQQRFEQWISAVSDGRAYQDQIDEVPEQWRRIASERGVLRRTEDGYERRLPPSA